MLVVLGLLFLAHESDNNRNRIESTEKELKELRTVTIIRIKDNGCSARTETLSKPFSKEDLTYVRNRELTDEGGEPTTAMGMQLRAEERSIQIQREISRLRAKDEEEKTKQARLKLLEERDPKIREWCKKNGYYIYEVNKDASEQSPREKEKNLPVLPEQRAYHICRKENIAHQSSYYSDEFAMIIGIE